MIIPLLAAVLAIAAPPSEATVKPMTGEPLTGRLSELSVEQVVIETSDGIQRLPAADILAIELPRQVALDKPQAWIDLLDGSKLLADTFTMSSGKATVKLTGSTEVEVPTRAILAVRFREQDSALSQQWRDILAGERTNDLVIVRKTSSRTVEEANGETKTVTETALDELDGTLLEVGPDSVKFDFDGDQIDIKREKIEGLIYVQRTRRDLPAPVCRLTDVGGSQWSLKAIQLTGDRISFSSAAGAAIELPLAAVAKLDFSVGNVMNLADLEADAGAGEHSLSLQPAAMTAKFGQIFRVSKLPPLGADAFRIAGKRYEQGLALHSPTTLTYRVPPGFQKLHAVAGVDDSVLAPGNFVFQVLGDGKELFRQEFGNDLPRGPATIKLDLTGVRRISIVVDPADDQDIGDQLNLCEARLTK